MQTGSTNKRHIIGAAYGYGAQDHGCQNGADVLHAPDTAAQLSVAGMESVENNPGLDTQYVTVDAILDLVASIA